MPQSTWACTLHSALTCSCLCSQQDMQLPLQYAVQDSFWQILRTGKAESLSLSLVWGTPKLIFTRLHQLTVPLTVWRIFLLHFCQYSLGFVFSWQPFYPKCDSISKSLGSAKDVEVFFSYILETFVKFNCPFVNWIICSLGHLIFFLVLLFMWLLIPYLMNSWQGYLPIL